MAEHKQGNKAAASTGDSRRATHEVVEQLTTTLPLVFGAVNHRLRAHGLHPGPKMMVLNMLKIGPLTQAALIDVTRMPAPSMSKLIDTLDQQGCVRRSIDPTDRRRMLVELTEDGNRTCQEMKQRMRDYLEGALSTITDTERATIIEALEILRRTFATSTTHDTETESGACPCSN